MFGTQPLSYVSLRLLLFSQCAYLNEEQANRSISATLLMKKVILASNQSYRNQTQDYIPGLLAFKIDTHSK